MALLNRKRVALLVILSVFTIPATSSATDCGSVYGVQLPCWNTYIESGSPSFEGGESLPYYPYAKRANGCSILGAKPGTNDSINIANINISFKDICSEHDKCYYTLGTSPWGCNKPFEAALRSRCEKEISNHAFHGMDIVTLGMSRANTLAACYAKAAAISSAVIGTQNKYHKEAQEAQKEYEERVGNHISTHHPELAEQRAELREAARKAAREIANGVGR
jgi:hypothetical protein